MRKYLAPNDSHKITIPLIVGAEYATPTADGKLIVRISGVDTTSVVPMSETTEMEITINTPPAVAGQLRLVNYMFTIPTTIGQFQVRETLGVVDLLDIPTTADEVRNFLGLNASDLEDENVDYIDYYLKYYGTLKPEFHVQRESNEYLSKRFGDLIALSAALDILPTLVTRLDKKRATENGEVTRLGDAKDLLNLKAALEDKLAGILDDLEEFLDQETVALTPIFQFVGLYQHSIGV